MHDAIHRRSYMRKGVRDAGIATCVIPQKTTKTALRSGLLEARQAREVRREVVDVALREVRDLAMHDRVLALAVLVVPDRGGKVLGMLSREIRELGACADAGFAVAGLA